MLLILSLIVLSCNNSIGDVSDNSTLPETPSEALTSEYADSSPEATTEDVTTEAITTNEATTGEVTTDGATTEEVTTEEVTTEEVTTEEVTTEEVTTEEVTTEEVTTEEVTTEEVTTEEVTTEEVTTEEVTTEEITTEEETTVPEPHIHLWGSWMIVKEADCTENGRELRTCDCGEEQSRDRDALGHSASGWVTVAEETCTTEGLRQKTCKRCSEVLDSERIAAKGHSYGAWTVIKSAGCVEKGLEERVCPCGDKQERDISALGHISSGWVTVAEETCTTDGLRQKTCKRCSEVLDSERIAAKGHSYGAWTVIKSAGCVENGLEERVCSCGEVQNRELSARGHNPGRWITEIKATCTTDGVKHRICSKCTAIIISETLEATGHLASEWMVSEELSNDEFSVKQQRCIYCDLVMAEERTKSRALTEAERVAAAINAVRGDNSFSFAALSDMHVDNVGTGYKQIPTKKSCEFAVKTLSLMQKLTNISTVALLGDYTASGHNYSIEQIFSDFEYINECFSDLGDLPVAWIRGNHEINYLADAERPTTNEELYKYIDSNSRGLTVDPKNPKGGYGYIDFPEDKIRMIFLNTSDVYIEHFFLPGQDAPSVGVSSVQLSWIASEALDFSDKNDASEWGIIINSHIPLNYTREIGRMLALFEAYKDGASGSLNYALGGREYRIRYDFSDKERAEIICNIHGHSHNFRYEKISSSSSVTPWLWRFCVPNICAGRENECATSSSSFAEKWGDFDENGDPIYYEKCYYDPQSGRYIYDEDAGTSYCLITVNRDTKMIYAHYVGTGRDRAVSYAE